jgi:hypothetical protein
VCAANAAPTSAAVTRRQWPRIKSRWRLQELLARVLSDFAFFDAKTTGKPHGITIEHIKHAR